LRSIARNYPNVGAAIVGTPTGIDDAAFRALAREIDAAADARDRAARPSPA
jgi:hypothetical protein